ncbi:crossover junction endodeoxyribonuclease RuvC [Candidatus Kaiserbacteria bacterium]|nr:crossover junction endodeoxyribonuclease RuvC [Candidatus Kaiserbacteria bacterium]
MKVLAIDPGYGRCGFAIVEKEKGKETLLYSECVETPKTQDFPERLATVVAACTRLIEKHHPNAVAIEKLYFTKNQKTAMHVAEVRGALIATAAGAKLPVSEYTPGQVKSAVAGWGNADKTSVAQMLHALVRIEKKILHDDEYDAIAIGLTHLAHAR